MLHKNPLGLNYAT